MIVNIYIVVFLLFYFLIVFIFPSIRVKYRTGVNPYVFKNSESAHDFLGKVSVPITSLIFIVAIVNLIFPKALEYFGSFTWLNIPSLKYAGLVLMHFSLIWIVIAQMQMNNSWRVGIDPITKTELKTDGLFSISRNPVFLGMIITLVGMFLSIPNAVTLLVSVVTTLLFQVQVRLEEEYLRKVHGDAYITYSQKVSRWF